MAGKWNLQDVWHLYTPPGRPCASDLRFIEGYVAALGSGAKALILGSTPEFRDLTMKYRIDTTCVDYAPLSFEQFKAHMKHRDESKLVNADWREMPLDGKYDVILGDLSFNMLPAKDWDGVAAKLAGALKKGGRAFQRLYMRVPGAYPDFEELVREHRERKGIDAFESLACPFLQHFVKEDWTFDGIEVMQAHLKKKHEEGLLTDEEFEIFNVLWGGFSVVMHLPTKEEADRVFSRHFSIETVYSCESFFGKYCPFYALASKRYP